MGKINVIEPIFINNYVAVAMSSSDAYLPYLSVCIQSLVDNSSVDTNYDIVVFSTSTDECKKQLIVEHFRADNISIRFFNPKDYFKNIKLNITHSYFNEACYFRIVAPVVMSKYSKLIFTDIDLLFLTDVKELYDNNVDGYCLAACKEPLWEILIDENAVFKTMHIKEYTKSVLNISADQYFNTGVVLFNVTKYNEENCFEKLVDLIKNNFFLYQEQCALNKLCNSEIKPLEKNWNSEIDVHLSNAFYDYQKSKIIHFLGKNKPWLYKNEDYADVWWAYAEKTPFMNEIIKGLKHQQKIIKNQINSIMLKVLKYKILSSLTFGEKHKYYYDKYLNNKKNVEILEKQL